MGERDWEWGSGAPEARAAGGLGAGEDGGGTPQHGFDSTSAPTVTHPSERLWAARPPRDKRSLRSVELPTGPTRFQGLGTRPQATKKGQI